MGVFVRGEVVVLPYPFTDLKASKRRPVMVLAASSLGDLVVLPITSKVDRRSKLLLPLGEGDFEEGALALASSVVVDKLFTVSEELVAYRVGCLRGGSYSAVLKAVISFLGGEAGSTI